VSEVGGESVSPPILAMGFAALSQTFWVRLGGVGCAGLGSAVGGDKCWVSRPGAPGKRESDSVLISRIFLLLKFTEKPTRFRLFLLSFIKDTIFITT